MNYKQRINEYPSVKPFGFTGIISKNSNLTIEKSYIEKGTSFVNAFNNSNVILKDCGTPKPIIATNEQIVKQTTRILKSEKDTSKLPPWINYKIVCVSTDPKYEENHVGDFERKNKFMIRLDPISVLDRDVEIAKNNINDRIKNPSDPTVSIDYTLENQLSKKGVYTSDISNTKIGFFALKYVESAIKAVWPLDKIHEDKLDNPLLNLHFVNREIFPMTSSQNKVIKIDNIAKLDNFGNRKKISEVLDISKNTHKKIVKVVGNVIQYDGLNMRLSNNKLPLDFISEVSTYYIMEPYYNNRDYICYYRQNGSSSNLNDVILINDELGKENTLYFRYDNELYSLFDVINERITIPDDLNRYYLSGRLSENAFKFDTVFENKNYIAGLKPISESDPSTVPPNHIVIGDSVSSYLFDGEPPALNRTDAKFYRVYDENTLYKNSVYLPESSFVIASGASDDDIKNHIISSLNEPSMQYEVKLTGALDGTAETFSYKDNITIITTITDASILSSIISTYIASSTLAITKNANYSVNFTTADINKLSGYTITQHLDQNESAVSAFYTDTANNIEYCVVFNNAALPIRTISFGSLAQSNIQELPSINNYLDLATINIGLSGYPDIPDINPDICISSYYGSNADDNSIKEEFRNVVSGKLVNYISQTLSTLSNNTYKPINNFSQEITDGTYLYYDNKFTKITNYKINIAAINVESNSDSASTGIRVYKKSDSDSEYQLDTRNFKITLLNTSKDASTINQFEYYYNDSINLKQKINISRNNWISNINNINVEEYKSQNFLSGYSYVSSIIVGAISGLLDNEYKSSTTEVSTFFGNLSANSTEHPSQDLNWFKYTIENELKTNIITGIVNPEISSVADLGYVISSSGNCNIILDGDVNDTRCTIMATFNKTKETSDKFITYDYDQTSFRITSSEINNIFDFSNSLNESLSIYQEFTSPIGGSDLSTYLNNVKVISVSGIPSSVSTTLNDYLTANDFNRNETIYEELSSNINFDSTGGNEISEIIFNRYDGIYFNIDESKEEIKLTDRLIENEDGKSYHLYGDHSSTPSTIIIGENSRILIPSYLNSQDVTISLASGYPEDESRVKIDLNATGSAIAAAKNSSIKFYYDKNEKIPVEFTNATDNVLALHDFNGSKIYIDNDDPKLGYRPMLKYVYEAQNTYELADFNDWYDIDTYVNYSLINSNIINDNTIKITANSLKLLNRYAEISGNVGIAINSNISSNFNMEMFNGIKTNIQDHNLSTLFVFGNKKSKSLYPGYKALSFNFMIPSKGWNKFDDEMYADNPNWMKNVEASDLYPSARGKLNEVSNIANKLKGVEFNGCIHVRYHLLKSGSRNLNLNFEEHYTSHSSNNEFIAKIFSDSFNTKTDHMMFSLVSPNDTLNFSTKLTKSKSNVSGKISYSNYYDLKNFSIDYVNQSGMSGKIQLDNLKFYIEYISGGTDDQRLFISTISNDREKKISLLEKRNLETGNISGSSSDIPSGYVSFNDYLNKDIVNFADITYYKIMGNISSTFNGKTTNIILDNQNEIDELTSIFTTNEYHSKQEVIDIQKNLEKLGVSGTITSSSIPKTKGYIQFNSGYIVPADNTNHSIEFDVTDDISNNLAPIAYNSDTKKWEYDTSFNKTRTNIFDYEGIEELMDQVKLGAFRGIYTDLTDWYDANGNVTRGTWNHNDRIIFDSTPYKFNNNGKIVESSWPSSIGNPFVFDNTVSKIKLRLLPVEGNWVDRGRWYRDYEYVVDKRLLHLALIGNYTFKYNGNTNFSDREVDLHSDLKDYLFKIKGKGEYVNLWSKRCGMEILYPHVEVTVPEKLKYIKFGNKWFKCTGTNLRYDGGRQGHSRIDPYNYKWKDSTKEKSYKRDFNGQFMTYVIFTYEECNTPTGTGSITTYNLNNIGRKIVQQETVENYKKDWLFGNLINNDVDSTNRFITWITPGDIVISKDSTDVFLSGLNYKTTNTNTNNKSYKLVNEVFNGLSGSSPLKIYDKLVKPFDMTTNLFLYQEGTNDNIKNSGFFAINARKMYNIVDSEDPKPENGHLNFRFSDLYDREIILTADIYYNDGNGNSYFTKEIPCVNEKNFDYKIIDEGESIGDEWKEVRYTDATSKAPQWLLYKLNSNVTFSTTDDFTLPLMTDGNFNSKDTIYNVNNVIEAPCKLEINFDGLLFKQKIRSGTNFDNVKDIDYSSRFISKYQFTSIDEIPNDPYVSASLADKWEIGLPGSTIQYIDYNSGDSNDLSSIAYELGDPDFEDPEHFIGGTKYFADTVSMMEISNSVNKWETVKTESKYSDLYAFTDYAPRNGKTSYIIGNPYLNVGSSVIIKQKDPDNEADYYTAKAIIAKIATDNKIVSNILNHDDISELTDLAPAAYPSMNNTNPMRFRGKFSNLSYTFNNDEISQDIETPETITITTLEVDLKNGYIGTTKYQQIPNITDVSLVGKQKFAVAGNNTDLKESSASGVAFFYIYFDGLLYDKQVYIDPEKNIFKAGGKDYKLLSVQESNVKLNGNGQLIGKIIFQIEATSKDDNGTIQIHNVKPLTPLIKNIRFSFNNQAKKNLEDGYYKVDDNLWARYIQMMDKKFDYKLTDDQPHFAIQEYEDIRSDIKEIRDDSGKIIGLHLRLKLKGFRKFDNGGGRHFIDDPSFVTLSSEEMLQDYLKYKNYFPGIDIEGYNPDAKLGDTVPSGYIQYEYNHITTVPFSTTLNKVGTYIHKYNAIDRDKFQLEIISKNVGAELSGVNKELFYVNLPVDRWYNLSLYKMVYPASEFEPSNLCASFGIQLTDITADKLEDVTTTPKEIFNVFTSNEKILYGLNYGNHDGDISDAGKLYEGLPDLFSKRNIEFDVCNRSAFDARYTNDTKFLSYSNEISESEYNKTSRKQKDLFKLWNNNSTTYKFNATGKKYNIYLFGNNAYNNLASKIFTDNTTDTGVKKITKLTYPMEVGNGQSEKLYVLVNRSTLPKIKYVEGMKCKSIMWISTPELSESNSNNEYFDMYYDAYNEIKKYQKYFNNPQNKLPLVKYDNLILDSDYATMVYNSVEKSTGNRNMIEVNEDPTDDNTSKYEYTNNPKTIAYVWDNSQVTRNESYINGEIQDSRLFWVKISNSEYISEIGSLYNYHDSESIGTIINVEAGAITQRQAVLMPIVTSPLSFEQRLNDVGVVTVNDNIITTAALGYNSKGYPINGLMVYNSNGSVSLDTTHTTYLYIAQNENQNDCKFGATQEKPVYVDTVQENIESFAEKFEFVPNPMINEGKTAEDNDMALQLYYGNSAFDNNISDETMTEIFESVPINASGLITGTISDNAAGIGSSELRCFYTYGNIYDSYVFDYNTNSINRINAASNIKVVNFIGNLTAFKGQNNAQSIDVLGFNVFYNPDDFRKYNDTHSIKIPTKCWETMNCYYFDGKLIPQKLLLSGKNLLPELLGVESVDNDNLLSQAIISELNQYANNYSLFAPAIAAIWGDIAAINKLDYKTYKSLIERNLSEYSGYALFDSYMGCNLTGVRLTINEEHLTTAPIYIKIYLLKGVENKESGKTECTWYNDPTFDIDLRETYKYDYDLSLKGDKEVLHHFIVSPDNLNLTKNVYGIKFVIEQIIPQNQAANSCIIDDIRIYTANKLNEYGVPMAVEDIYVRKNDANCRNFYNMKVNEYVWRLPNSPAEWSTVNDILKEDLNENKEYINDNAYAIISGNLDYLVNNTGASGVPLSAKVGGDNSLQKFSLLNTYYITNSVNTDNSAIDVISDNYMNQNENISITWKYVDYVYVYYESYANSRFLLEKNFGNAIYSALKNKLNANIENLNLNSALKDKYTFTGGIAVSKSEIQDVNTQSLIFDWKSSAENIKHWTNVHTTALYDIYGTETTTTKYERTVYTDKYAGKTLKSSTATGSETKTEVAVKEHKLMGHESIETVTTELRREQDRGHAILENPQFTSIDKWTSSFEPIRIKYKIN